MSGPLWIFRCREGQGYIKKEDVCGMPRSELISVLFDQKDPPYVSFLGALGQGINTTENKELDPKFDSR